MHTISVPIVKGERGFGFTVADAALGQIVKDIVQPLRYLTEIKKENLLRHNLDAVLFSQMI